MDMFCGGGKKACGALRRLSSEARLLICHGIVALTPWTSLATIGTRPAAALTAFRTFAAVVIVALAQHCRLALLKSFGADCHEADDIFVDTHLPFHFGERGGRGIDIQKREMCLAVLLDPVGQGFHSPIFHFLDFATEGFDDSFELRRERLHLLGGNILTRQIDVLVKSHWAAFLFHSSRRPGAEPFEPGKARAANEGGDTGRANRKILPAKRAPVQPPARAAKRVLYKDFPRRQSEFRDHYDGFYANAGSATVQTQGPHCPLARIRQDFNPALATTIRPLFAIATRCLKTSGVSQANGFSGSHTARYSSESGHSFKSL